MSNFKKGGAFLLETVAAEKIFIREDLNEEQIAFGKACHDFFENEVAPQHEAIENHQDNISVKLMKKAGDLGFLMVEVPEEYGGLGMDKRTATVISEASTAQGSFSVTMMCHTGISTLPILYYGTEAQKKKYLPKLASGEFIGAYALTEAGSGSDALGAKTKAVLSQDGKYYTLNGSKMFITNGAWADIITVFAQVEGNKFTAFLVEKGFPGLSHAAEEKKMGIKGSSTVVINLDDCKVPVENILGEVGKGHKIAFNILNLGRWKLGAAAMGGCKRVLREMIPYTKERKQFGKSISEFGLIRKKIADCTIRTFVTESMMYRIAGLYDEALAAINKSDPDYDKKCAKAIEEYTMEASIAKIYGSEALWSCADEGVQALGGYGFCSEYPMEVIQRDCRINRIFEGTNEINRLIIPGTLVKRAMQGEIDFMAEIQKVLTELKTGFGIKASGDFSSGTYADRVNLAKKLTVYACGVAVQKFMEGLKDQQLVMEKMANLVIDTFAVDSIIKRTNQILAKGKNNQNSIAVGITQIFIYEAYERMLSLAKDLLAEVADGNTEEFTKYKKAIARFDCFDPINTTKLREAIAVHMLERNEYNL